MKVSLYVTMCLLQHHNDLGHKYDGVRSTYLVSKLLKRTCQKVSDRFIINTSGLVKSTSDEVESVDNEQMESPCVVLFPPAFF